MTKIVLPQSALTVLEGALQAAAASEGNAEAHLEYAKKQLKDAESRLKEIQAMKSEIGALLASQSTN